MPLKSTENHAGSAREVSLEEKVAFLRSPAAYPGVAKPITVRETHMSWVFLIGDQVFKLKKPLRNSFLNFSTLEARKFNCQEEIRLNRRLASDVYLGAVPLAVTPDGKLAIDSPGRVVDWLVKMRRLPEEQMLDDMIAQRRVTHADIDAIADRMATFYARLGPADLRPEEFVAGFRRELAKSEAVLTRSDFDLPQAEVGDITGALGNFLTREGGLLRAVVERGQVVEGHGDLRPEHVCLTDPPAIIDCLEFNRSLRLVDPIDELAFLGLECEVLGAPDIGPILMARFTAVTGLTPEPRLTAFYTGYRASLRARLCLLHLLEPKPRQPDKWLPLARTYLAIARRALG